MGVFYQKPKTKATPPPPPAPKPPRAKSPKPKASSWDEQNTEDAAGKPVKGSGRRSGLKTDEWGP